MEVELVLRLVTVLVGRPTLVSPMPLRLWGYGEVAALPIPVLHIRRVRPAEAC